MKGKGKGKKTVPRGVSAGDREDVGRQGQGGGGDADGYELNNIPVKTTAPVLSLIRAMLQ